MSFSRRKFIEKISLSSAGALLVPPILGLGSRNGLLKTPGLSYDYLMNTPNLEMFFKISLAEWSFHKALFSGKLKHIEFPAKAASLGIFAVEYVNQFFKKEAENTEFLNDMNKRTGDLGIKQVLIMIDGEGGLGDPDDIKRKKAVENHYKWVDAAKYLGCHSIRVNAFGIGSAEDVMHAAIDGLGRLSEYAAKTQMNILVENHGGYSSNGKWLSKVMEEIGKENCGTLPDFGNFCLKRKGGAQWGASCIEEYDTYLGIDELMSFAKAVSAKSYVFDADGNERNLDFLRIMKIVKKHGYTGHVGIEYEGDELEEEDGILATKKLLEKVGTQLG